MDQQTAIAQVRQRYTEEVRSAERELRSAQDRYKAACSRLEAVEDVVQAVFGKNPGSLPDEDAPDIGPYAHLPLRDAIISVVTGYGGEGATAREIEHRLLEGGFPKSSKNFNSIVHITCKRLVGEVFEVNNDGGSRRYVVADPEEADQPILVKEDTML